MRAFLITDQLNQLHWAMLKSIAVILAILPISHILLQAMQNAEGSSQIMIGFFALSILSTNCIVSFVAALQITTWQNNLAQNKSERVLFKIYQQIPMLFLTAILVYVVM
ncbi:hypothetical protein [Acinetobacter puyangensis]|uniref:hypothetical protein n=1 Tax=Acinetobacter puyangensis TaxID=1096779 RepID=UPI003A4DD7AE